MDAREARQWLKTAERRKYADYSDYGLGQELVTLRRKAKNANKSSVRKEYEAQVDEIIYEIFLRQQETGKRE